jgi:Ca2+-binding EF-hand superfamily protein
MSNTPLTIENIHKFVEVAFAKYDKDHNGTLEYGEVVPLAVDFFKNQPHGASEKEVKQYFNEADTQKNGHVTRDELLQFIKNVYRFQ